MSKKTLILGVVLIVCLGLFAGCGSDYEYKDGDFTLEIMADNTNVSVGDMVEVTVKFKNASGCSLPVIFFGKKGNASIENIIDVYFFSETIDDVFIPGGSKSKEYKKTLKANTEIVLTRQYEIKYFEEYTAFACTNFYIGNKENHISVKSNSMKIIII